MKKITGILILALSAFLFSCQKEDLFSNAVLSEKSATIIQNEIAVDNVEAEVSYEADFYANAENSISMMARKGLKWNWKNILRYRFGQCPDVTIDSTGTGYPKTITLNYGNGVELNNGRVLSGVITIVITAPPKIDGSTKTVSYNNFSVDSISVTGSIVFKFAGDNVTTRSHTQTGNLIFTLPDGKIITREITKSIAWLAGVNTSEEMTDDIIQISGSVKVSTSDGAEYSKLITNPIIKKGDCRWFVQGIVEISINGETKLIIDYGDGECDGVATITRNGITKDIDLKGKNPIVKKG